MPTQRSLNKLERKAHMSVHNTVNVADDDKPGLRYTRDRFGKKQRIEAREYDPTVK